jgi:hypothetical protein
LNDLVSLEVSEITKIDYQCISIELDNFKKCVNERIKNEDDFIANIHQYESCQTMIFNIDQNISQEADERNSQAIYSRIHKLEEWKTSLLPQMETEIQDSDQKIIEICHDIDYPIPEIFIENRGFR